MSTLRVSTLQDTTGNNGSTPAAISRGIAKAWIQLDGTSSTSVRRSHNVSSVTKLSTGRYQFSLANTLSGNYSVVATSTLHQNFSWVALCVVESTGPSSFTIASASTSNGPFDSSLISFAIFD